MSFNITPVVSGYQEIHPYSAMNIDSVKINTSLIMMKECIVLDPYCTPQSKRIELGYPIVSLQVIRRVQWAGRSDGCEERRALCLAGTSSKLIEPHQRKQTKQQKIAKYATNCGCCVTLSCQVTLIFCSCWVQSS